MLLHGALHGDIMDYQAEISPAQLPKYDADILQCRNIASRHKTWDALDPYVTVNDILIIKRVIYTY